MADDELDQTDRPYHSKRAHRKSRKGCKNCKVRKVKCDEARPTCRSCRLRKVQCAYPVVVSTEATAPGEVRFKASPTPDPSSSSSSQSPTSNSNSFPYADDYAPVSSSLAVRRSRTPSPPSADASSPVVIKEPLYRPSPTVDELDMKLLWFYTTTAYTSFTVKGDDSRPIEDVMKTTLVRYAFEAPFLMHSIFALSGLHLQHLDGSVESGRALTYTTRAFEGYRRAIEEAKPETFPALVANSLLLTALSSQAFRDPNTPDLYIIDWMIVWRGIRLILGLISKGSLFESGLGALFYRPTIDLDEAAGAIPSQLLFMISSIPADDPDYEHVPIYYTSLKYLGSLYLGLRTTGHGPILNLRTITWLTFIPSPFVDLCRLKRPRALVILAHYGAFLKMISDVWWIDGVGQRTMNDVCNNLGPEWYPFLTAPLMAAHEDDRLPVARILLEDPSWESPATPQDKLDAINEGIKAGALVDDEGREVLFLGGSIHGKLVLKGPKAPHERPTWHDRPIIDTGEGCDN